MRKGKSWLILVPIILIILVLVGGFVYIKISTTPKKIFEKAISKTIDEIKEKQVNYSTLKLKTELSANIESDKEEAKEISKALDNSKLSMESQMDIKTLNASESIEITYDGESLINAKLIAQDNKAYVQLKDWFNKYIELSAEDYNFSQFENVFSDITTVNKTQLLEEYKKELINVVSKQTYTKETVTMNLNGQDTKVTKSSLKLNSKQLKDIENELITNLKNNNNFLTALVGYKESFLKYADEINKGLSDESSYTDSTITISIYTKGLFGEFVAVDLVTSNGTIEQEGIGFIKTSKEKFEYFAYNNENETRKYTMHVLGEIGNGQGTITFIIPNDEKDTELVCKYQQNNNQITYEITTETEGTKLNITGSVIQEGKKYSGNAIVVIEVPNFGKVNLSCLYSLEYDAVIEKIDTSNAVLINEMTKEEQNELVTNVQNSKIYELISEMMNPGLFNYARQAASNAINDTAVSLFGHTVNYSLPLGAEPSQVNTEYAKSYNIGNNTINVSIEKNTADQYLEDLSKDFVLTSEYYENQEITDISDYTVEGNTFKYRGITYKDSMGEYLKIFFVYEIDSDYIYVVGATIENNSLSLEQIIDFLKITVE